MGTPNECLAGDIKQESDILDTLKACGLVDNVTTTEICDLNTIEQCKSNLTKDDGDSYPTYDPDLFKPIKSVIIDDSPRIWSTKIPTQEEMEDFWKWIGNIPSNGGDASIDIEDIYDITLSPGYNPERFAPKPSFIIDDSPKPRSYPIPTQEEMDDFHRWIQSIKRHGR